MCQLYLNKVGKNFKKNKSLFWSSQLIVALSYINSSTIPLSLSLFFLNIYFYIFLFGCTGS